MNSRKSRALLLGAFTAGVLLLSGCSGASGGGGSTDGGGEETYDVAVVLKTLTSPFWLSVVAGAEAGGEETGAAVTLAGATAETNIQEQIDKVRAAITQQVDALVVAPTAADQLQPVLQEAVDAGIPVLLVDTNVPGWDGAETFIGTDNRAAGVEGGEYILSLAETGKIAYLSGVPGNPSTDDRVAGVKEALEGSEIEMVADLSANSDRAEAVNVMSDILQSDPDVNIVFAANDDMALGAIEAIRAAGKDPADFIVIGVDGNRDAVESILAGELTATIAQNPFEMGRMGVTSAVELLNGGTIEDRIDTGADVIDADSGEEYLEVLDSRS